MIPITRKALFIVGLGGTLRPQSSTERLISHVLKEAEALGASTQLFTGNEIDLPMYVPHRDTPDERASALVSALRRADAVVVGSPGYHGGVSGLVKNALDYIEDLSSDQRPYLDGRAVGCIATGAGWQGANSALHGIRSIVHALRGWPTPLGIAANTGIPLFDSSGACLDGGVLNLIRVMADQLVTFAKRFS